MGRAGKLPWHLPADLKHFQSLTVNKPVVMGRKTFAAIGKPLPRRRNIVLTRDASFAADGVDVAHSIEAVWRITAGAPEIAVIGGAEIFDAFTPFVDAAYVTEIDDEVEGDVYYRPPARSHVTKILGQHSPDERNAHAMRFVLHDYTKPDVIGGSENESKPSR
jgi:dihydrofolate reductase